MKEETNRLKPSWFGKVVGLTGNPGAGKSTVADWLNQWGAKIVSGDKLGHEMLLKGSPVFDIVVETFGGERNLLDENGDIIRRVLGEIVFASQERLEALNAIVHPPMLARLQHELKQFRAGEFRTLLVVDAALIYEWRIEEWFDTVVLITASAELRRQRFLSSRGGSRQNFDQRETVLIPQTEKEQRADIVINNDNGLSNLRRSVESIFSL